MSTPEMPEMGSNFLRSIIDTDLKSGRHQTVVTRFPPEPNGYPHIGHAKSICLNFGLARDFGGRCHLRMDDTNPSTEDMEYVEALKRDVQWLGFDWGEHMYFASDYFEALYDFATGLIRAEKAYVCSLSEDEIRSTRGSVNEAGTLSPIGLDLSQKILIFLGGCEMAISQGRMFFMPRSIWPMRT